MCLKRNEAASLQKKVENIGIMNNVISVHNFNILVISVFIFIGEK